MVILLDGTSQMGRVTIAEKAVEQNPQWRHLALEVLAQTAPSDEEGDAHLQVIKRCADELAASGLHLVLTMPSDSPHRRLLSTALKPDCITVHLGEDDGQDYDFVMDPKEQSVNDVTAFLGKIMSPEEE